MALYIRYQSKMSRSQMNQHTFNRPTFTGAVLLLSTVSFSGGISAPPEEFADI